MSDLALQSGNYKRFPVRDRYSQSNFLRHHRSVDETIPMIGELKEERKTMQNATTLKPVYYNGFKLVPVFIK